MWICPKCGSDNLSVEVKVRARLIQYPENFETELEDGDHEWDGASTMTCNGCKHMSRVSDFDCADASPLSLSIKECGFGIQDTGGGCLAYVCDDGVASAWITDISGSRLPTTRVEPMIFGIYVLTREGQQEVFRIEGDWTVVGPHAWNFVDRFPGVTLTQADIDRKDVAFSVAYEAFKSARDRWTDSPACEYLIESTDIFASLSMHGLPCTEENEAKIEEALIECHFNVLAAEAFAASQEKGGES